MLETDSGPWKVWCTDMGLVICWRERFRGSRLTSLPLKKKMRILRVTSFQSRLPTSGTRAGSVTISPTIFRHDSTARQRSSWGRSGVPAQISGVWRAWSVLKSHTFFVLAKSDQLTIPVGIRADYRRLPFRPPVGNKVRQRRRSHCTNHRVTRSFPQITVSLREVVARNIQSQRRTSEYSPVTPLGFA